MCCTMWTLNSEPSYASIGDASATAITASPDPNSQDRCAGWRFAGCARFTERTAHA
jgi:hypothetical protein